MTIELAPPYEYSLVINEPPPFDAEEVSDSWGRCWSNLSDVVGSFARKGKEWWNTNRTIDIFRKYSDLMVDCVILSVDTVFLVGSLFPELIPAAVTSFSYASLEYIGLLGLIFTSSLMIKTIGDTRFSLKMLNWKIGGESLGKLSYLALSVSLTVAGCAAGTERMLGNMDKTNEIYKYTRPLSEISIVAGFIFLVYYYVTNRKIIGYIKEGLEDEQLQEIVEHLKHDEPIETPQGTWRAADIRARMDKDTWWDFEKKLKEVPAEDHEKLREIIKQVCLKNIETQQTYIRSTFLLRIAGDIGMAISDWYPGTVIQAIIDETFSILYTSVLAYKKYQQHKERKAMSAATSTR